MAMAVGVVFTLDVLRPSRADFRPWRDHLDELHSRYSGTVIDRLEGRTTNKALKQEGTS